jgi:hypothetical protein
MSRSVVPFLDIVADELRAAGYAVTFCPQNRVAAAGGREDSASPEAYRFDILDHDPVRSLASLTDQYDIPSPRSLVFGQMNYDYQYSDPPTLTAAGSGPRYLPPSFGEAPRSFEPYVEWLHRCLDFFDQLFADGAGGIPLQYQGSEIIRQALQCVAEHHDVPAVWIGFSPIPGHSGYHTDRRATWPIFETISYDALTADERARAEAYVERFRNDRPTVRAPADDAPTVGERLRQKAARLRDEDTTAVLRAALRLKRRLGRSLRARYARRSYRSPTASRAVIGTEDYVFYPLQYYIESRVTMRAPAFYEQSWLIEYLSRSTPTGHELVTKDHPQQLGAQSRRAIADIARHSIPVAPSMDAHDVVQNAAAVVTLNNTVGYEALLYGTPVVSLGDAFYDPYTYDVEDINRLDRAIDRAIREGGPTEETIVEFAHGIIEGSDEGVWRDSDRDNVATLVDGVLETVRAQR